MELIRYADRPDLRELRRAALNEFPEFMNHNEMGGRYWGRLYDEYPEFQLALVDAGELVAEVHALAVPVEGDELPAGWDEAFERGMEAGGGNVLSLLAISVSSSRRGGGLATQLIGAAQEAAARAGLESVIAPVRPTLKERYPLISIEEFMTWRRDDGTHLDPWLRVHERVGGRIERCRAELDADRSPGRRLGAVDADAVPGRRDVRRARHARPARGRSRPRGARRAERLGPPQRVSSKSAVHRPVTAIRPFCNPETGPRRRILVSWHSRFRHTGATIRSRSGACWLRRRRRSSSTSDLPAARSWSRTTSTTGTRRGCLSTARSSSQARHGCRRREVLPAGDAVAAGVRRSAAAASDADCRVLVLRAPARRDHATSLERRDDLPVQSPAADRHGRAHARPASRRRDARARRRCARAWPARRALDG